MQDANDDDTPSTEDAIAGVERAVADERYCDAMRGLRAQLLQQAMTEFTQAKVRFRVPPGDHGPLELLNGLTQRAQEVAEERQSPRLLMAAKAFQASADFVRIELSPLPKTATGILNRLSHLALTGMTLGAVYTWMQIHEDGTVERALDALREKESGKARLSEVGKKGNKTKAANRDEMFARLAVFTVKAPKETKRNRDKVVKALKAQGRKASIGSIKKAIQRRPRGLSRALEIAKGAAPNADEAKLAAAIRRLIAEGE